MKTYAEHRPTEFDPAGAFIEDGRKQWLVAPVMRHRDSTPAEESNFEAALGLMGGEGEDVEVHRFGHWGHGWYEIALVRPGTDAALAAGRVEARLADYGLLDEDDLSAREMESYNEAWESWGAREFAQALASRFDLDQDDEEILLDADKGRLQELFEGLNPAGDYMEDGAPVLRRSLERATREGVEEFLEAERAHAPSGPR